MGEKKIGGETISTCRRAQVTSHPETSTLSWSDHSIKGTRFKPLEKRKKRDEIVSSSKIKAHDLGGCDDKNNYALWITHHR